MNKKASAIILACIFIVVLIILGGALLSRSISENSISQKYLRSSKAFWFAEAGVAHALQELHTDYHQSGSGLWTANFADGGYSVDVVIDGDYRKVTSHGFCPAAGLERTIEVMIVDIAPTNFYDNAIYSSGNIDINGTSYTVDGKIVYATTNEIGDPEYVTGTITQDPAASPLARFDFEYLRGISVAQQNLYVMQGNQLVNAATGSPNFPTTFWHSRADDSLDNDNDGTIDEPDEWVPNVVYVEADLTLNGNIGTIGGFFVVAGDVITDPDANNPSELNGNGQIDGVIYTLGDFRINGGGGNLNINGGVWAGGGARVNGNSNVTYNSQYMNAIKNMNIIMNPRIVSWKEQQNPYSLQ